MRTLLLCWQGKSSCHVAVHSEVTGSTLLSLCIHTSLTQKSHQLLECLAVKAERLEPGTPGSEPLPWPHQVGCSTVQRFTVSDYPSSVPRNQFSFVLRYTRQVLRCLQVFRTISNFSLSSSKFKRGRQNISYLLFLSFLAKLKTHVKGKNHPNPPHTPTHWHPCLFVVCLFSHFNWNLLESFVLLCFKIKQWMWSRFIILSVINI